MDRTFQTEVNEDRRIRAIGRAWSVLFRGSTVFSWLIGLVGLLWLFAHVIDVNPEGDSIFIFVLLFYFSFRWLSRRKLLRWYRKAWRTQLGGAKTVTSHLTDDFNEYSFGESHSKSPWRTLATSYLFMDDAVVLFLNNSPCLVFHESDLQAGDIKRTELEAALRNAGLKSVYELLTRKIQIFLMGLLGLFLVLCALPRVSTAIASRECDVRTSQVRALLFREVHGTATDCPYAADTSWQSRFVSSFLKPSEPDECLYVFNDEEEYDKVGIFARYGERSYESYLPCGCACAQPSGYFDRIKELHKPTVFFESEKEKWLEKVRPIANDLNFSDDEDDEQDNSI